MLLECLPDVINAAVYGGDAKWLTRDPKDDERAPFRILIAGGGTGDPLLACAHAFYLADIPVEVVHLDLSHASIKIAQRRAEALLPPALARRLIYVRGGIAEAAAVAGARNPLRPPGLSRPRWPRPDNVADFPAATYAELAGDL